MRGLGFIRWAGADDSRTAPSARRAASPSDGMARALGTARTTVAGHDPFRHRGEPRDRRVRGASRVRQLVDLDGGCDVGVVGMVVDDVVTNLVVVDEAQLAVRAGMRSFVHTSMIDLVKGSAPGSLVLGHRDQDTDAGPRKLGPTARHGGHMRRRAPVWVLRPWWRRLVARHTEVSDLAPEVVEMRKGAKLTVGYDGSEGALRAVRWAVDAAEGHAATVNIVACYGLPVATDPWLGLPPVGCRARWRRRIADGEVGRRAGCAVRRGCPHRAPCGVRSRGYRLGRRRGGKRSARARAFGASCARRRVEARIRGSRCFAPRAVPGGARPRCSTVDAGRAGGRRRRRVRRRFRCCASGRRTRPTPGTRPSLSSTSGHTPT